MEVPNLFLALPSPVARFCRVEDMPKPPTTVMVVHQAVIWDVAVEVGPFGGGVEAMDMVGNISPRTTSCGPSNKASRYSGPPSTLTCVRNRCELLE